MSRMSAAFGRARTPYRMVSGLTAALLLAIALSVASPSRASAAEESEVVATWTYAGLSTDVNGNGRPDVGDDVLFGYQLAITGPAASATMVSETLLGGTYGPGEVIRAGAGNTWSVHRTVTAAMLDSLGGGLHFGPSSFTYTIDGVTRTGIHTPPPLIYTAPAPLSVATAAERVGSTGAQPIEGDRIRYTTTVTNTAAVAVTLTGGTGVGTPAYPITLNPGQQQTFNGAFHAVTYDDMVAGDVAFSGASLNWSVTDVSGILNIPLATVTTEPYRFSVDAGVNVVVSNPAGTARVNAHDAVVGDRLDYTFQMTNTGNVTVDWVSMSHRPVGTSFDLSASSSGHKMAPGESLTDAGWGLSSLTSLPPSGSYFTPHVITASDLDRGYVDLEFRLRAEPEEDLTREERDDPKYYHPVSVRTLFRDFTTSATLAATATLNDTNGDGLGQVGETVTYNWRVTNTSDQDITLTQLRKRDPLNTVSGLGAESPDGTVIARGGALSGSFTHTLNAADLALGIADFDVLATIKGNDDGKTASVTKGTSRIHVEVYVAPAHSIDVTGTYLDANGDGHANVGETVTVKTTVSNDFIYPLIGIAVSDGAGSDVTGLLPSFPATVGALTGDTREFTHVLTVDDLTRGHFFYTAKVDAEGASTQTATPGVSIPVIEYIAPAATLDTSATYDDANADGFPSIGETVTVTTTAANNGGYPLTGLTVTDAPGADVTGLLPAFAATLAPGTDETQTFDYVLTAADFARGTFDYATTMTADGMSATDSSTAVALADLTFQAYESDLDAMPEGDISVCVAGVPTSEVTLGTGVMVSPGRCSYPGAADGYRVVAFSTPMLLGADTFNVTLPSKLRVGVHRLALYAPDGTLVGWKSVTAKDPVALAFTGVAGTLTATGLAALVLMIVGGSLLVARRRVTVTAPASD